MENMPKALIQNVNHPQQLRERMLDPAYKQRSMIGSVLLLTDKYETSALFYSLAYKFRSSFIFGECRAKNLAMAKEFGVKKYPLIIALVPKGKGNESYSDEFDLLRFSGDVNGDAISSWLEKVIAACREKDESKRRNEWGL
jgi:hypothetical protein